MNRLLLFSLAAVLLTGCKDKKPEGKAGAGPNKIPPAVVEVQTVKDTVVKNILFATGSLLANEEVELRSEVNGRITGIYFQEGSAIGKGQLLVKIDDSELRAQIQKRNLDLKLARTEETRQKKLLDIEAISQGEFDVVSNRVETLESEKNLLLAQLQKTEIRAPFSGIIGLRYVSNGGYVSPNTKIAVLQQLDPVKIEFSIPESYSSAIKTGADIRFKISGSDEEYTGTVYASDLAVDPATRTIKLRARTPNPNRKLVPGSFARIELNLGDINNALMVPAQAIIPELNGQKVFIAENGKAKSQKVDVGVRTESHVQVTDGLKRGDSVIVSGIMQLKEGSSVTVKGKTAKEGAGK